MKKLENKDQWKGVWTALITPFDTNGNLDRESLDKLINDQIKGGISGLVIAGSTGEGSLLDDATYETLLKSAVEIASSRIPIVAGLGIGGTKDCLSRATIAKKANASGFLASPPAYIKTPVRGLVQHYLRIAEFGLPICLYDVPSRSAIGLPEEVVDSLLASKSAHLIHAVKDATGNPERIKNKSTWKASLALLSGDDESFPAFMQMGGHGIVSVASHFALADFIAIQKNPHQTERFDKITSFIKALYWESNPIPTKSLAHKLKWIKTDTFQEPLCPMAASLLEDLYELYTKNYA